MNGIPHISVEPHLEPRHVICCQAAEVWSLETFGHGQDPEQLEVSPQIGAVDCVSELGQTGEKNIRNCQLTNPNCRPNWCAHVCTCVQTWISCQDKSRCRCKKPRFQDLLGTLHSGLENLHWGQLFTACEQSQLSILILGYAWGFNMALVCTSTMIWSDHVNFSKMSEPPHSSATLPQLQLPVQRCPLTAAPRSIQSRFGQCNFFLRQVVKFSIC